MMEYRRESPAAGAVLMGICQAFAGKSEKKKPQTTAEYVNEAKADFAALGMPIGNKIPDHIKRLFPEQWPEFAPGGAGNTEVNPIG